MEKQEWSFNEKLPEEFVDWLRFIVRMKTVEEKKYFIRIATELGVQPSYLSRWLAGFGPLRFINISILANAISPVVYILLRLPRPDETVNT